MIILLAGASCTRNQAVENTQTSGNEENGQLVIKSFDSPTLGKVLTDERGMTLYVFTKDTEGQSTCYGQCAEIWSPVLGEKEVLSGEEIPNMFTFTSREDGAKQLTYNGKPLYYYNKDLKPGDTNGEGVNGVWYTVKLNDDKTVQNPSANDDKQYSLADIAVHNSREDCWMAIENEVYNVTEFISKHPGGDKILQGCGKDATSLFTSQPAHKGNAQDIKEQYEIGKLKK